MVKTVSLFGFPTVESPEAVTKFLEEYAGEGTVQSVNVLPPKRRGSRSSAIVQFTTEECAEIILNFISVLLFLLLSPFNSSISPAGLVLEECVSFSHSRHSSAVP
ncbi:hypothetical protein ACLB2K_043115 [Fragaria x ananassa]